MTVQNSTITWEAAEKALEVAKRHTDTTDYVYSQIKGMDDSKKVEAVVKYAGRFYVYAEARLDKAFKLKIANLDPLQRMAYLAELGSKYNGEFEPGFKQVEDELRNNRYEWLSDYNDVLERLKKSAPDLFEAWHIQTKEKIDIALKDVVTLYLV